MTAYQRASRIVTVTLPCPRRGSPCKPPRFCRVCVDAVRFIAYEIRKAEGDALRMAQEIASADQARYQKIGWTSEMVAARTIAGQIESKAKLIYPPKRRRS